jgi:hypothetical protein
MRQAVVTFVLLSIISPVIVDATGGRRGGATRAEVLDTLLSNKHLIGVDPEFDCSWRSLAFEFAQQLQPWRPSSSFVSIHDGLELSTLCNVSFASSYKLTNEISSPLSSSPSSAFSTVIYVDSSASGDDAGTGTINSPLAHISAAVLRARSFSHPVSIILRAGVHHLSETLNLGPADNGLKISAFPGENPIVSGGLVIKPVWTSTPPPNANAAAASSSSSSPVSLRTLPRARGGDAAACVWTIFPNVDSMWGDFPDPLITNISTTGSATNCQAACVAATAPICHSWTYYDANGGMGAEWDGMCFLSAKTSFDAQPQAHTSSGTCVAPPQPPNVYVADLTASGTPLPVQLTASERSAITLLYSADGSGGSLSRAIRARYPNADPELDLFPTGWASGGARTSPTCDSTNSTVTNYPLPGNYGPAEFSDYAFGAGGPCDRFEESEWLSGQKNISYWCQPGGRTNGCSYFVNSPSAITVTPALLPHSPYTRDITTDGATLHYWRDGHWFSMMTRIDTATVDGSTNSTTLGWSYGAFQGAEGDDKGEDWFIEHVAEELDAPREFFFEAATQRLYYFHNDTAGTPPPATWQWEVPVLSVLVNITGADDVTLDGITFTAAAATYLAPHGLPSGGDWGLARQGAVFISNANRVTVSSNTFTRLDGNAVFLSGFTRNVTISKNEFSWLGESGVASWGFTDGVDATAGMQPWGTVVSDNLCREIGQYEKQVSCYFAAVTAGAEIARNIFFNMPRAAVNVSDT